MTMNRIIALLALLEVASVPLLFSGRGTMSLPMARLLTFGLMGLGFLVMIIAAFRAWGKALEESLASGLGYLWPPYAIYYLFTRWEKMRGFVLLSLIGSALLLLGGILGQRTAVLPP